MSAEFDWTDAAAIVCEHQPAIAVYVNPRGQAVIRQEATWPDDADHIVLVNPENIIAAAYALLDQLDGAYEITERVEGGWCDVPRPERPAERRQPKPEAEPEHLALPAPSHAQVALDL